ncbi:unnamed protein product [Cyprideis torosa]|uniref:Uncharacterized protein n=1 Tax=Cyprideis torosa TaxID=163714 RepID=A0A7R8X0U5_9CRUS|nr:unnamed protein product [Cyprideis torosa]CAG0911112.1 unnamed protein product [Cyprideis torosa]
MEDTLIELKSSCAGVIAQQKKLVRKTSEMRNRRELWNQRATLAIKKERDDLAREALLEKKRLADLVQTLEDELEQHDGLVVHYREDIGQLEEKLNQAKEKKRLLTERHKQARSKRRAQEDIRRMDSAEAMARFEKFESTIERMEAEADLVNMRKQDTTPSSFDELQENEDIEKELAKLKEATYGGKRSDDTAPTM